jgi:hypothetical protein
MRQKQFYTPFQNFVFRTPLYSVNTFFQEMEKLEKEENYWKQFLQTPLLQEAIFLASPVLYDEINKFLNGHLVKEKDIEKMKNAVLRYFSRMCSRCTPFGLFAGFSMGRFGEKGEGRKEQGEGNTEKGERKMEDENSYGLNTAVTHAWICTTFVHWRKIWVKMRAYKEK